MTVESRDSQAPIAPAGMHPPPDVLRAIDALPTAERSALLDWTDEIMTRLTSARPEAELTPADAAFHAIDVAVARERMRIARELHDNIAADLATAIAMFKLYFKAPTDERDPEMLRHHFEVLESMLRNTRDALRSLRPRRLGPGGLMEELRTTVDEYESLYGIRIELWSSGSEDDLTISQREVVFQIVREALTNVRRHSGATTCRVRLGFAAVPFLVEVADEGRGFSGNPANGYGLVGMRERAVGIGGRLEVVSTPGRGTTVFLFGPERA